MDNQIKNIIFDMGNVLLTYDPVSVLNKYCPDRASREIVMNELYNGPEWEIRDLGLITMDEQFSRVKKRVPEKYHKALYDCTYNWTECMKPIASSQELFKKYKKEGMKVFVLSNASDDFFTYFGRFADPREFDGIIYSAMVHMLKPDIEIYKYALKEWGIKAEESYFLDDRQENVDAARAVGMQADLFGTAPDTVLL